MSGAVQAVSDVVHNVTAPIIDPVVDTVSHVSNVIAKDPILSTGAAIALTAAGVPAPLSGALVAANAGASPENIAKAAALGYVGGEIAQNVAPEIAAATDSKVLGQIAGQAAGSAGTAALTGRDPIQAALNAAISGGVSAGTSEVLGQVEGFSDLTPTQQRAVSAAVSAELQGKDPTAALIRGAINIGREKVQDEIKYAKYDEMDFGVNQGAVDKVNAEKAQNDFYDSIGIKPDTVKDTAPATTDVVDQLVNSGLQETPPTVQELVNPIGDLQTKVSGIQNNLDAQAKDFMDQLQQQGYSYQDALTAATQEMGDRISGLQTQFEGQLNDYGKSTMDALQKQGLSYTDALNAAMQQQNEAFNSQFSTLDAQNQQLALDLVKQGYTYDEALQGAMQSQAEQLAAVQSGLNTQIGNVQSGLNTQIGNVQSNLGSQINKVGSTVSDLQKQVQTQAAAQQQQNQLQSLLSLMALSQPQQQQPAMQDPYAKIKSFQGDLFGEDISTDFLSAATGGSVDDLLRLLRS